MTILERAFDLAGSGSCRTISDLEKQLKREGYSQVAAHLSGLSIRRQLRSLLAGSHAPTPAEP
jgi:hypothetical protein